MCHRGAMDWYLREQLDLVSTLRDAGPDAPTLCAGWRSRHLAAHVYLRLHRPWQMATGMLPGGDPDAHTLAVGEAHARDGDYQRLLDRFLAPMAPTNPMRLTGEAVHLLEYVVHHEDVLRAAGHVQPRALPAGQVRSLWTQVCRMGRLTQARSHTGMVLVVPGGPRAAVRRARRSVAVSGDPVELALYLTGRTDHADVHLSAVASAVPVA